MKSTKLECKDCKEYKDCKESEGSCPMKVWMIVCNQLLGVG